jgi:16S rRNA (guanine527-N7)-methyltransferase
VKEGGYFLSMKSVESEEEINSAKKAIATLGGKIEKCVDYTIPGTDVSHRLVFIKKVSATPKKYPRAFAKIKKNPL